MNPITRLVHKLLTWRHEHFVVSGNRFRDRRLRFFVQALVREDERILDIGYGYGQFEGQLDRLGIGNPVVALDIVPRDANRYSNVIASVVADAAFLPFADRSIDIIYCNSMLEHVGDWPTQRQTFKEIARVGRKLFVQTPNRHFPIEAHHLIPFFQYWPHPLQEWFAKNVLGHYEEVWLLGGKAVTELADVRSGIDIWEEKVLGLTKSYVLYRAHSPAQEGRVCRQTR